MREDNNHHDGNENRLYPLSRVSIVCRVVGEAPCLGERYPLEGVKPQMLKQILLCQPWEGRVFSKPFLGRNDNVALTWWEPTFPCYWGFLK